MPIDEQDVYEHITKVVQEMFEVEPARIKPTASLRGTLRLDSADLVDLAVRLENEYGLAPDLEGYRNVNTLKELAALVAKEASRAPE
jgi:acyl carrier protein